MAFEKDQSYIFFEVSKNAKNYPHAYIECIPVTFDVADKAPQYFREAIYQFSEEWSQHKKIIDTSKNGIRRSLVKNLPYVHVWFGLQNSIGHVIEDEEKFPRYFGAEVIGGILDLPPNRWRKPRELTEEESEEDAKNFRKAFEKFDWTKMLNNQ